jgi:hypothetical protein
MALLWLCVAVGLTGWAVQRSAQVGRVAAPPRYADIDYFNERLVAFTLGLGVLYTLPTRAHQITVFRAAFGAGLIFLAVYSIVPLIEVFRQRVGRVPVATGTLVLLVAAGMSAFRSPLAEGRPCDPGLP